ncbi:hypothetical protein QN388_24900, partial [Pseudomonas sp. 5B4]|nr:hypothetical protein [Pseudomonas sp. 5B4]
DVYKRQLPVRWLLSQKFDSIDKIAEIHMPVLIVHGMDDPYVPSRFSEALYLSLIHIGVLGGVVLKKNVGGGGGGGGGG